MRRTASCPFMWVQFKPRSDAGDGGDGPGERGALPDITRSWAKAVGLPDPSPR